MADVYGNGLLAYLAGDEEATFVVECDMAETEEWPVATFFRSYDDMPEVERIALEHVEGAVLDVGAGAGSHALYLQRRVAEVTAIDISAGAVEVMRKRGVKRAFVQDFFEMEGEQFDTLLLMMNGIGIVGGLEGLPNFFKRAEKLLKPGGKILLDSSDLIYLYEDEDGETYIDLNAPYYGELEYVMSFGGRKGTPFKWLFVDFDTLSDYAAQNGFSCEKLYEDDHYLYLAELRRR